MIIIESKRKKQENILKKQGSEGQVHWFTLSGRTQKLGKTVKSI